MSDQVGDILVRPLLPVGAGASLGLEVTTLVHVVPLIPEEVPAPLPAIREGPEVIVHGISASPKLRALRTPSTITTSLIVISLSFGNSCINSIFVLGQVLPQLEWPHRQIVV